MPGSCCRSATGLVRRASFMTSPNACVRTAASRQTTGQAQCTDLDVVQGEGLCTIRDGCRYVPPPLCRTGTLEGAVTQCNQIAATCTDICKEVTNPTKEVNKTKFLNKGGHKMVLSQQRRSQTKRIFNNGGHKRVLSQQRRSTKTKSLTKEVTQGCCPTNGGQPQQKPLTTEVTNNNLFINGVHNTTQVRTTEVTQHHQTTNAVTT